MFIGYQTDEQGNDRPVVIAQTREEIEIQPLLVLSKIDTVDWAEIYNYAIYTDKAELQKAKEAHVREVRDSLLKQEVDPVVTNPLRWGDLTDDEKAEYSAYRRYLLGYDKGDDWWEKEPLTMGEWKKEQPTE